MIPNPIKIREPHLDVVPAHPISPLEQSIMGAVAYADLFDYPLSLGEIRRYQISTSFSAEKIAVSLATSPYLQSALAFRDGFYCLRGREETVATRLKRRSDSRGVWKRAQFYAKLIAGMPFVRMVAVTGALAVDNIAVRPDIDLLLVTGEGRVWVARRLIIGLVRLARLLGDDLCPNYIISENNLNLEQRDLFTAHELAQMVPLFGKAQYRKMLAANSWALHYLPAAFTMSYDQVRPLPAGPLRRVAEKLLRLPILNKWERWELARLQKKMKPLVGDAAEVVCSPQQCKGHTGLHRQWVTARYEQRLNELGL